MFSIATTLNVDVWLTNAFNRWKVHTKANNIKNNQVVNLTLELIIKLYHIASIPLPVLIFSYFSHLFYSVVI